MTIEIPDHKSAEERNKWLRNILATRTYEVTFTKVDGDKRVMPCTLNTDRLPSSYVREAKAKREANHDALSVFCTDKNEWRSFRVMNVIEIKEIQ
jgi:hypothetical protein